MAWLQIKKAEFKARRLAQAVNNEAYDNISTQLQAATGSLWSQTPLSNGKKVLNKVVFEHKFFV